MDEISGRPIVWEADGERFVGYLDGERTGEPATAWRDGVTVYYTLPKPEPKSLGLTFDLPGATKTE